VAGSRTLKLSILADVADLRAKMSQGSQEVEGFGSKVSDFGKKAGLAFAAAGAAAAAYAGKLLIDGVKAAVEDEAAQAKLAGTLTRVAGATSGAISEVEKWISAQGVALGVTDDELRPAFDRLARSTNDIEEAQKLATLAMDISAATGKSLESVSTALAKAQDGNVASLAKLTGGFEAADLKGKTLNDLLPTLTSNFQGAAEQGANTFSGKLERLQIAFGEAKETVGSFVLDAITPLVTNLVDNVIPTIQDLADRIGTTLAPIVQDLAKFFTENIIPIFKEWWDLLSTVIIPGIVKTVTPIIKGLVSLWSSVADSIKDNEDNLKPLFNLFKSVATFVAKTLAPAIGTILGKALTVIGKAISGLIDGFSSLIGLISDVVDGIKAVIKLVRDNPLVQGIGGLIDRVFGGGKAAGGAVNAGTAYVVGERGAELFVPKRDGMIVPNHALGGGVVNNYNINVSGAIDPIGVARAINNVLGREATISGAFANFGQSRVIATT
jgi:phage-related protein